MTACQDRFGSGERQAEPGQAGQSRLPWRRVVAVMTCCSSLWRRSQFGRTLPKPLSVSRTLRPDRANRGGGLPLDGFHDAGEGHPGLLVDRGHLFGVGPFEQAEPCRVGGHEKAGQISHRSSGGPGRVGLVVHGALGGDKLVSGYPGQVTKDQVGRQLHSEGVRTGDVILVTNAVIAPIDAPGIGEKAYSGYVLRGSQGPGPQGRRTLLATEGTPVADLQGLMGHASLATTQGYLDSVARDRQAAAAANPALRHLRAAAPKR